MKEQGDADIVTCLGFMINNYTLRWSTVSDCLVVVAPDISTGVWACRAGGNIPVPIIPRCRDRPVQLHLHGFV